MPAFWVSPNKSPLGALSSRSSVRGSSPGGPSPLVITSQRVASEESRSESREEGMRSESFRAVCQRVRMGSVSEFSGFVSYSGSKTRPCRGLQNRGTQGMIGKSPILIRSSKRDIIVWWWVGIGIAGVEIGVGLAVLAVGFGLAVVAEFGGVEVHCIADPREIGVGSVFR
ncbi:MAG: hypothetical protein JWP89_7006 [Schlesneria sp.]|nr:hypothetical protein [Schlesneria sp.]